MIFLDPKTKGIKGNWLYLNSLLQRWNNVSETVDPCRVFAERTEENHLIDVLEGTATFEKCRSSSADEKKRTLGHLGILHSGDGVRQAGTGCHSWKINIIPRFLQFF